MPSGPDRGPPHPSVSRSTSRAIAPSARATLTVGSRPVEGLMAGSEESVRRGLRARLTGPLVQSWVVDANDGIIATAGLLEGFAGAGADDQLLITAALAATITGALPSVARSGPRPRPSATPSSPPSRTSSSCWPPTRTLSWPSSIEHYVGRGLTPELAQRGRRAAARGRPADGPAPDRVRHRRDPAGTRTVPDRPLRRHLLRRRLQHPAADHLRGPDLRSTPIAVLIAVVVSLIDHLDHRRPLRPTCRLRRTIIADPDRRAGHVGASAIVAGLALLPASRLIRSALRVDLAP